MSYYKYSFTRVINMMVRRAILRQKAVDRLTSLATSEEMKARDAKKLALLYETKRVHDAAYDAMIEAKVALQRACVLARSTGRDVNYHNQHVSRHSYNRAANLAKKE
jgi:hypothetical protein